MTKNKMLEKARSARRESKYIDFKERFDVNSLKDWCETIKDIVAMSNSGWGIILIGVRNDGTSSEFDVTPVLNLDPAQLTDKIARYTGKQFSEFEITEIDKNGQKVAIFLIYGVYIPMVFIRPGTYAIGGGRQQSAFGKGTVYFRHGAKSEPGNSNDLRRVIERELERIRKSWLDNIRKVFKAPPGYSVQILSSDVGVSNLSTATPIRIVDEPSAPGYRLVSPDSTHPYRQKEVIQLANERLSGRKTINAYDVLCVRRVHKVDETKPQYCYKPKYASPQYSDDFVGWLVKCYEVDSLFFDKAREKYRSLTE
jgi:hypothetical protein